MAVVDKQPLAFPQADMDSPWKHALSIYLEDFMALCFPEISKQIDWMAGHQSLDKEFLRICKNAKVGLRHGDKLIKVRLKSGDSMFILCHLEIQASFEAVFPERMLVYRYRIEDVYHLPVLSIAILLDNNLNWRPRHYKRECFGTSLEVHYHVVKLLDYEARKEELERMNNPFSMVILAQLTILESAKDPKSRLYAKTNMIRALYDKNWQKEDVLNLYHLIDWLIILPEELVLHYNEAIKLIEEERKVRYITSMERGGIQKGLQQGRQEGQARTFIKLLEYRFGEVSKNHQQVIQHADEEKINFWMRRALTVDVLAEVFQEL
ncbi:MAG: cytosolic protein [Gammaproteobacteria bacterium]|jgi:hypothetical protein|nr:cytosolic protein [Gammaproteobacteria bacterium]